MQTVELADALEYEDILSSAIEEAKKQATREAPGNFNVHRIDVCHQNERPILLHTEQRIRPGGQYEYGTEVVIPSISVIDSEDAGSLLIQNRLHNMSSPFYEGVRSDMLRPFHNVVHDQDLFVFSPQSDELLSSMGDDLDLIARDIEQTANLPYHDLQSPLQDGIEQVSIEKKEFLDLKQNFMYQAGRLYAFIMGYYSVDAGVFKGKTPREAFNMVEEAASLYGHGDAKGLEVMTRLSVLESQLLGLRNSMGEFNHTGVDVFSETLSLEGFYLPSDMGVSDALNLGIGSGPWMIAPQDNSVIK